MSDIDNARLENMFNDFTLIQIFKYLSPTTLSTCRLVCSRWQQSVQTLTTNESLWRRHCRIDFPDIFESAYCRANPRLSWYNLYRSLKLWDKLDESRIIQSDFIFTTPDDEIKDVQMLHGGVLAVHKTNIAVFYDINTSQEIARTNLPSTYDVFRQNSNLSVLRTCNDFLYVTWKNLTSQSYETTVIYNEVQMFLLLESSVYYVTWNDEIYLCEKDNETVINTMLVQVKSRVKLLSVHNNILHILTYVDTIFSLFGNQLRIVSRSNNSNERIQEIFKLNFFNQKITARKVIDIITPYDALHEWGTICSYGNVILDAFRHDYLRIDTIAHTWEVVMAVNNLTSATVHIEVVEGIDSHKLFFVTRHKIILIHFTHE